MLYIDITNYKKPIIFLENFHIFLQFFPKISTETVTVSPRFHHYCKFTIRFTIKFTLMLIKILQSVKFEGSHFTDC